MPTIITGHYQHNPYAANVLDFSRSRTPSPAPEYPSFMHNPYDARVVKDYSRSLPASPGPEEEVAESGTLHAALASCVNFIPYPDTAMRPTTAPPKSALRRLFVGQLPYGTSSVQAEWIIHACTGVRTYHTELIHSWRAGQQPKGCVHTYCFEEEAAHVMYLLHHAALVDDSGVWYAADGEQQAALDAYCADMKMDKKKRFRDRPYQPVVVELADSTFVRRNPRVATLPTPPYTPELAAAAAVASAADVPPSYNEFLTYA